MARPRKDRFEAEEEAGFDGLELTSPLDGYRPLRLPGPTSTLKPEWIEVLARAIAEGDTYAEAASRVGATEAA
ncbi:MAG TPA: hypothetical protein VEZ71_19380, partial [Archangium sp.]|nr:hypothetical protein [Archangium sp.]